MGTLVHSISFLISAPTVPRIPSCNDYGYIETHIFFLVAEFLFILIFEVCYIAIAIYFGSVQEKCSIGCTNLAAYPEYCLLVPKLLGIYIGSLLL